MLKASINRRNKDKNGSTREIVPRDRIALVQACNSISSEVDPVERTTTTSPSGRDDMACRWRSLTVSSREDKPYLSAYPEVRKALTNSE